MIFSHNHLSHALKLEPLAPKKLQFGRLPSHVQRLPTLYPIVENSTIK